MRSPRGYFSDEWRRGWDADVPRTSRRCWDVDIPWTSRGDAAAGTRTFRGETSQRRRRRDPRGARRYDLYAAAPLDALAEGPGAAALLGAAGAAVAAGAAAAAIESVTFTWARPPPTRSDETNAIADALATDALAVRLLETRAEKGEDRPSAAGGPAVVKTMRQAADRAVADGEAFERVADAWLMNFHGLSSAEIEVNDKARETKNYPAIAAAFASGTAAGAAYAAGGLGSALGVHALGSLVDILAPPPSELQPARSAQFDVDAAIGTATTKAD